MLRVWKDSNGHEPNLMRSVPGIWLEAVDVVEHLRAEPLSKRSVPGRDKFTRHTCHLQPFP